MTNLLPYAVSVSMIGRSTTPAPVPATHRVTTVRGESATTFLYSTQTPTDLPVRPARRTALDCHLPYAPVCCLSCGNWLDLPLFIPTPIEVPDEPATGNTRRTSLPIIFNLHMSCVSTR